MRSLRSLILICSLALTSGCLPVAWVSPPVQMEIGIGTSMGVPADEARITMPLAATLNPLQLLEGRGGRLLDFGVGYSAHFFFVDPVAGHGPHLDLTYIPLVRTTGAGTFGGARPWRMALTARPGYRFAGIAGQGPSAGLRLTLESVGFTNGVGAECETRSDGSFFCGSYLGYGEDSYGLYIEATRALTNPAYTTLSIGFSFRIPATAGAGLMGQF